jgi:biofilm protein TabA
MIIDTLDNIKRYQTINPLMDKVVEFLAKTDLSTLKPGKIHIQGEDLFINVSTQDAKERSEAPLESHLEYIDIQIPVSCDEEIGYTPGNMLSKPSVQYDSNADIAFYPGLADTYIEVRKGMFVIFFPGEGHAPAITSNGIHKLIIKMRK